MEHVSFLFSERRLKAVISHLTSSSAVGRIGREEARQSLSLSYFGQNQFTLQKRQVYKGLMSKKPVDWRFSTPVGGKMTKEQTTD